MNYLDLNDPVSINNVFCEETGIKKVKCYVKNKETGEIRFYSNRSSKYRLPKNWKEVETFTFNKPVYPNLFDPHNFLMLLNVQWYLFGSLGCQYRIMEDEEFQTNYLITRIKAIQLSKSLGGGELLDMYMDELQNMEFDYLC